MRVLIPDSPTVVASFSNINKALAVAIVAVVVERPEVAVFVERKFLRIAQSSGEHLEVGAVGIATKYSAFIGKINEVAFLGRDVGSPVADGEIDFSVRAKYEAM